MEFAVPEQAQDFERMRSHDAGSVQNGRTIPEAAAAAAFDLGQCCAVASAETANAEITGRTFMFKNILLPTDGSALSKKAIKAGVAFAKSEGARIVGFYSPEQFEILSYGEYFPPDLMSRAEWDKRAKKTAEKFLGVIEKEAKAAGVPYSGFHLASLAPWEAIAAAAKKKKCDLIFMASHARTGLAGLLLGSQAAKVASHSKIPVLIYR
jgi:nucleotide-binding universal stress UspA family protein